MKSEDIKVYFSPKGQPHTVHTRYTPSGYEVRLDGKLYALADDLAELNDTIRSLVKQKRFTETPRPKRNTPLVPASK